jgi:poly-gamma-glutamate synthesis protein (capsule biosynthesis protein)
VYEDAFQEGTYNFESIFQNVKVLLEKPDIVTANQESMLGGAEMGLSSYPTFNSPHQVADALVDNGIDIVSTANNHSLDKGEKGIDSEADYLNKIGLPQVGTFINPSDQQKLRIIERNGIKLAFLSYTYGTNGIPLPAGKSYLVNLVNRNKMAEEIHHARTQADITVLSIHWGTEYQRLPNKDQKDLARYLVNEGADIIFGSHPHVLQPMEWMEANDGRKALVVYSLGNFISGQMKDYKDIGGLVTVDVTKHADNNVNTLTLSNPVFTATYVASKGLKNYRVVPLELASNSGLANAEQINREIQNHMTQWLRK